MRRLGAFQAAVREAIDPEDLADALTAAEGTVEVAALPTRSVYANEMRLLFLHLVGNAMKFRHRDRPLRIVIDAVSTGDDLVLRVTDNGPGIPDDLRERVLEPFFTSKSGGSGLGLYLVREIVIASGGSLSLSSTEGRGTGISIRWPLAESTSDRAS